MKQEYDVVVIGGGTAGTIAAIQAGRAGASCLLVEKNGILGGAITVQGINNPSSFFAWGRQVVAGIGWELVCDTLRETNTPEPTAAHSPRRLPINTAIFAALADRAALEAGVELLFHAMPATIARKNGAWRLSICTKTGLRTTRTKVLIDASGDANAVALAGFEVVRSDIVQPATLSFRCSGYNHETLDYTALKEACARAIAAAELRDTDIGWYKNDPRRLLCDYGRNANHVRAIGAHTSEGKSCAEIEGRQALLRMYRFFRRQPGLENFHIDWVFPEVGIRETVTIKGKNIITTADYEAGRFYDDALCYASYPIDEHLNDGNGINFRPLKEGILPTIPRSALLPANSNFLMVAGRTLASEREANSALRVQCPCMAMGQAAGAMAALSAHTGRDPEELPLADIRALLRDHGAIVPQ